MSDPSADNDDVPGGEQGAHPEIEKTYIKRFRVARKWTQADLGARVGPNGVSAQAVQAWEAGGTVSVDRLFQLAQAFGVTPAELIPGGVELSNEEEAVLAFYRSLNAHGRHSIFTLARGLAEAEPAGFEVRKAASGK